MEQIKLRSDPSGENDSEANSSPHWWLLPICVAAVLALRLYQLDSYSFWMDEIFSLRLSTLGTMDLIAEAREDLVHPPLYYLLLKSWLLVFPANEIGVRSLSVLLSTLALVPIWQVLRLLKTPPIGLVLASAIFALSGFLIWYGQQARSYALVLLLAGSTTHLWSRLILGSNTARRDFVWLALAYTAAVYCHYYFWLLMAAQWIAIAILRPELIVRFTSTILVAGLAFAPWVIGLLPVFEANQGLGQNLSWIDAPTWRSGLWFFTNFHGSPLGAIPQPLSILAFGTPAVLYGVVELARLKNPGHTPTDGKISLILTLGLLVTFPIISALVMSNLLPQAPWGYRHLTISVPAYVIVVAYCTCRLRPDWLSKGYAFALLSWSIGTYAVLPAPSQAHVDFRDLVRGIESSESNIKLVQTFEKFVQVPMDYYGSAELDLRLVEELSLVNSWIVIRLPKHRAILDQLSEQKCAYSEFGVTRGLDYEILLYNLICPSS